MNSNNTATVTSTTILPHTCTTECQFPCPYTGQFLLPGTTTTTMGTSAGFYGFNYAPVSPLSDVERIAERVLEKITKKIQGL